MSCMHDIRFIRDNPDAFDRALARRGLPPQAQRLIELDEKRREKILALETAQARRNAASKEIGEAKKAKDEEKAKGLLIEVAALKESIPAMEAQEKAASKELEDALAEIPNLPLDDVPDGKDEKRQRRASSFRGEARLCVHAEAAFRSRRSARPDGFRDRGQTFRRALCRVEEGPRAARTRARRNSCSMCTRASTATPKSRRRSWCAMK